MMNANSGSEIAISVIKTFCLLDTVLTKRSEREDYFSTFPYTKTISKLLKWAYLKYIPQIQIPKEVMDRHRHTLKCTDANERLYIFISKLESFVQEEISLKDFKSYVKELFREKLHQKESLFYKKILNGSMFSVDYSFIRDVLNNGEDFFKGFVKFTKAYNYVKGWNINFPAIGEINYDGVKLKVIYSQKIKGVFTESELDVSSNFSCLIDSASWYARKFKKKHVELDIMVVPKEGYTYIAALNAIETGNLEKVSLVLIDVIYSKDISLKERITQYKLICVKAKRKGIDLRSGKSEILNCNQDLTTFLKKVSHAPNGIIIKSLKSIYTQNRTMDWVKIREDSQSFKVRVYELIKDENQEISSFIGRTNNGQCLIVRIRDAQKRFFKSAKNHWLGCSVEVHWVDGELFMIRMRPDKNDIIEKEEDYV